MDDLLIKGVKQWYSTTNQQYNGAFRYLTNLVQKAIRNKTDHAVPFHEVQRFLEESGITLDMVRAIGFESISHFIYHMENKLVVQAKELNGRTFYNLCLPDDARNSKIFMATNPNAKSKSPSTLPAPFSKILVINRTPFVPLTLVKPQQVSGNTKDKMKIEINRLPADDTDFSKKKRQEQLQRDRKLIQPQTGPGHFLGSRADSGPVARDHPIVKIKRTFVFEPPDEPQNRYRLSNFSRVNNGSRRGRSSIR